MAQRFLLPAVVLVALLPAGVCRADRHEGIVELRAALPPATTIAKSADRELIQFDAGLIPGLSKVALNQVARVGSWPLQPKARGTVLLTRYDVYASDARIVEVRAGGQEVELPRSRLRFFDLVEEAGPTRGFVSVDVEAGRVYAMSQTTSGMGELRFDPSTQEHLLARADDQGGTKPASWGCGGAEPTGELPDALKTVAGTASPMQQAALTSLHRAKVDIDTDTEFMAMARIGGNTVTATNYIASLFGVMNVMYERDLRVRLVQGTTFLRTASDPYVQGPDNFPCSPGPGICGSSANSAQLSEFASFWSANPPLEGVRRATAALLSGKSAVSNGASGIASLDALCSTSGGYSFSQVFQVSYLAGDAMVVGHEIGHNFGSPHTHCPNSSPAVPIIDHCFSNGGSGCFVGTPVCPAAADYTGGSFLSTGTLMSYCHLVPGCISNTGIPAAGGGTTQMVFHPSTRTIIEPRISSALGTCIFPLSSTGVSPNAGPTTGGTSVTISGGGFVAGATVTFGGAAATGVAVVNASTITATVPAHATGPVDVVITNPSLATATIAQSFFYGSPAGPFGFNTVTPCRILDTRGAASPALQPNSTRIFTLAGSCGITAGAKAVSLNVTVVSATADGSLELYPGNAIPLGTNTISYRTGVTRANNIVVELATNSTGSVGVQNLSAGTVHFIVDVNGYFE